MGEEMGGKFSVEIFSKCMCSKGKLMKVEDNVADVTI